MSEIMTATEVRRRNEEFQQSDGYRKLLESLKACQHSAIRRMLDIMIKSGAFTKLKP